MAAAVLAARLHIQPLSAVAPGNDDDDPNSPASGRKKDHSDDRGGYEECSVAFGKDFELVAQTGGASRDRIVVEITLNVALQFMC